MLLTYQDTVERLLDYLGAQASDSVLRDCKQAATEALRDLVQAHTWTYLYRHGRLVTSAAYSAGTIAYQASGGAVPYQVTLSGGTWPTWATFGTLRIGLFNYDVAGVVSPTVLALSTPQVPQADFADSVYTLFQASYSLPADFAAQDVTFIPDNFGGLSYVHPREWLAVTSQSGSLGTPTAYTIMADPDIGSRLALKLAPFPDQAYTIEYLYKRHPAPLSVFKEAAGTVAATSGSATWTGTSSNFLSGMVGKAALRVSGLSGRPPTANFGDNPAAFESKLLSVTSPTVLTTWDTASQDFAGAPYTISSYLDIETGAMTQAYLRCCEMHISMSRIMKDKPSARNQYHEALEVAKCADSRSMAQRRAGVAFSGRRRLRDYPINLQVES